MSINDLKTGQLRHVVVVDDDEIIAYAFTRYLTHRGHHVSTAHSSDVALKIAEKIKIDILVTDYRLGSTNGKELLDQIRRSQPDLPAIIVSAYTDEFHAGDDRTTVLRKPVSLELLAKTIEEMVDA